MPNWSYDVTGQSNQRHALDAHLRDILALEAVGRGDEIYGAVEVFYSDEDAKRSSSAQTLQARGVQFHWSLR